MNSTERTLVVVAGPTAVGKTALSIALAQYFGTEVVSADARQVYTEMSIGTAKPTESEMAGIPHHFIGSHSVQDLYSVGSYEADALQLLSGLFQKHPVVVLAGGSGLYVRALCEGLDQMPEADLEIREKLQQQLAEKGLEHLFEQLKQLDSEYAAQVDRHNPQRVLRGLEVCLSTGQPFSLYRTGKKAQRPFRTIKIGLTRDREELYERVNQRVDQMLENGLLEEAKALYPYRHLNALQTVGYSEIFGFLDGQYNWEETVRLLKRNTRRYAKRQLTWFRRDAEFTWFHPDDLPAIIRFVEESIAEGSRTEDLKPGP